MAVIEIDNMKIWPRSERKKTDMEEEHQKNGRTGFFDLWRTLSRQFSIIHEGYVLITAVIYEELVTKHFRATELLYKIAVWNVPEN